MRSGVVVAVLGGLLILQVTAMWFVGDKSVPFPPGPVTGEAMPSVSVTLIDTDQSRELGELLLLERGCTILIVADVECPVCARMRHTWQPRFDRWADSVSESLQVMWLFGNTAGETKEFLDNVERGGAIVAILATERLAALRQLGVYGTPTLYIVDRDTRLRLGISGFQLPTPQLASKICE